MDKKNHKTFPYFITEGLKPEHIREEFHSAEGKLADLITSFSGSMLFVYFHVIWFGLWILINQGLFKPHIPPFDLFPYGLLTMAVSLEAIFLATFIMISQNRHVLIDKYRELKEIREIKAAEEDVEDLQKDLDDIKNAISFIQQKIVVIEKIQHKGANGSGNTI